jgi:nucleoside-diphosphate-sugar epimerase
MADTTIVLAGATGNLGGRIARALRARGAIVRALVRRGSSAETVSALKAAGVTIVEVSFADPDGLTRACAGATCVVSALSGLRGVIVDAQTELLHAAVTARVPRFIPSDYCIDFTKLAPGSNRNLDLRRDFRARLDAAPIAATSILNGAFAELLTGQAPIVIRKFERVVFWQDADQLMDFTAMDDAAAFTAAAALDDATPRFLRIAGDEISARGLASVASEITRRRYRTFRAGGLRRLRLLTRVARLVAPGGDATYPPWQGMQYLHDMFSGEGKLHPLDRRRYGGIRWTTAANVLRPYLTQSALGH